MTLFIALLLLQQAGQLNALTAVGSVVLWVAHLNYHSPS